MNRFASRETHWDQEVWIADFRGHKWKSSAITKGAFFVHQLKNEWKQPTNLLLSRYNVEHAFARQTFA